MSRVHARRGLSDSQVHALRGLSDSQVHALRGLSDLAIIWSGSRFTRTL